MLLIQGLLCHLFCRYEMERFFDLISIRKDMKHYKLVLLCALDAALI